MAINFKTLHEGNSDAAMKEAIQSIHRRASTMQLDIHRILYAIAYRWNKSGDVRQVASNLNLLLDKDQLGGVRKNAIRMWIEVHLQATFIEEGELKGQFFVHKSLSDGKHINLNAALNERWWEMQVEAEYKPVQDAVKLVKQLIAKLEKDRAKVGLASVVNPALIEALKAVPLQAVKPVDAAPEAGCAVEDLDPATV